jgi:cobalt-zinc-cadmium efflux system outer membrane protein
MKIKEYRIQLKVSVKWFANTALITLCSVFLCLSAAFAADEVLNLQSLIDEALKNNREVRTAGARWNASTYRIPQAESLPDPMITFGYQNEGWNRYTYGEMQGSQWIYSVSQTFPFPGKRSLKGQIASSDEGSLEASYKAVRLKTITTIKELYYDLFLTYRNLDIISDRKSLFSRIEDAALARYSSGMASQQEVLMAQTEKYMLLEKETMLRQKTQSLEAMLNNAVGRDVKTPLGRPPEPSQTAFAYSLDDVLRLAYENSPEIRSKEKMLASSKAQINLAQKDYYPDFTIAGSVYQRTGEFQDMWSLTATINIPVFFGKKSAAVAEARSLSYGAESELEGTRLMLSSSIRDNYSMLATTEKLMGLYKTGLIPKTQQDFELALSGYGSGKIEAITVINRLKALLDYETLYWGQFVEREKTVARIESIAGIDNYGTVVKEK